MKTIIERLKENQMLLNESTRKAIWKLAKIDADGETSVDYLLDNERSDLEELQAFMDDNGICALTVLINNSPDDMLFLMPDITVSEEDDNVLCLEPAMFSSETLINILQQINESSVKNSDEVF